MSDSTEEILEMSTSDVLYSRSEMLKYQGATIGNQEGAPYNGEYPFEGVITRFKNGLLHGGLDPDGLSQPAYERDDSHSEWFEDGLLHCENGPAVIANYGTWEEYWNHGKLFKIRSYGLIEKSVREE